jgi:prophage tail gpP-like protein
MRDDLYGVVALQLTDDFDVAGAPANVYHAGNFQSADLNIWDNLSLRESFLDPLGQFSFSVMPPLDMAFIYEKRLKKGTVAYLSINGHRQATVVITTVTTTIDNSGITFKVSAKSLLAAPYEGSVDPGLGKKVSAATPMSALILDVMAPYGFEEIINETGSSLSAKTGKKIEGTFKPIPVKELKDREVQAKSGESAYQFCSKIFSRLGVVLVTDPYGRLLLTRPFYDQPPSYHLIQTISLEPGANHMISVSITDTNDNQFTEVVVRGQAPITKTKQKKQEVPKSVGLTSFIAREWPVKSYKAVANTPVARARLSGYPDPKDVTVPFSTAPVHYVDEGPHNYKSASQIYKPKYVEVKRCTDIVQCERYTDLLFGVKNATGFVVRCEVEGFIASTGKIWTPNTVASVRIDAFGGFREDMWILERSFTMSRSGGQKTQLTLLPLRALQLGEVPS